jgi:hypothetical protein
VLWVLGRKGVGHGTDDQQIDGSSDRRWRHYAQVWRKPPVSIPPHHDATFVSASRIPWVRAGARAWLTAQVIPYQIRSSKLLPRSYIVRSRAQIEHDSGKHCSHCYGISTKFHHVDADMERSIQSAKRVDLYSLVAQATEYPRRHPGIRLDSVKSPRLLMPLSSF